MAITRRRGAIRRPRRCALTDIRYYQDLAQRAEAALFDSIFLADQLALGGDVAQARAHLARADHRAGGAGGGDEPDRD